MELRPYQKQAIDNIHKEWQIRNKTLIVLATGTGKTVCFSKIIDDVMASGGNPLVIAHRDELLTQAREKLFNNFRRECDVASIQSMSLDKNLLNLTTNYYSHIIIDEAHHCLSNSYQKVLNHFSGAKVLGVTATPDRMDKKNLGQYFESIAFEYGMKQAIEDGYLCKIIAQMIPLKIDISNVGMSGGDYDANACASAIEPYMEQIADEMVNYCKDRKTIVFLPLIETSQKFVEILNSKGFNACEVNGSSPDRKEKLKDFEDGKYNVMCNSMLLTEGYDCPSIDCVIVLRPTKSRALYQQIVGRGTRLSEGKENLLLLDFLWNTEKHSLCRPSSLVAKTESVSKKIDEKVEKVEEIDLLEVLEESEQEDIKEREESLAKELRKQRFKKKGMVDPIQFAFSIKQEDMVNYVPEMTWEMSPPSDKQLQALANFGIDVTNIPNMGYASALLDRCMARSKEGMTSAKQIRFLECRGFKDVGKWKKEEASAMISAYQANRWFCPRGVIPETYKPESLKNG